MIDARHTLGPVLGAAASLAFLLGSTAMAQTPTTMQGPAAAEGKVVSAPAGAAATKMPLAGPQQFRDAEQLAPKSVPDGTPGFSGDMFRTRSEASSLEEPMAFGSSTAPYTTRRVAVQVLGNSTSALNTPVTSYPFRATGKLYFKIGTSTYVCSASLVKKGVLVTAAHCVHEFGKSASGWHTNFVFCPANTTSSGGVYGCYNAGWPRILTAYYNGSDTCTQSGVVCNNDVATLLVPPVSGVYAGSRVGWYGYGWNGYSYRASSFLGNVTTVQISQLGYPAAFDSGYQMQRTDAVGWYYASGYLKNTQIGSAQTGGSSGGPWLVNLGTWPSIDTTRASHGSAPNMAVVGVTSYGSTTVGYNRQGSSFFGQNKEAPNSAYGTYGAGNIGMLMQATCTASPANC